MLSLKFSSNLIVEVGLYELCCCVIKSKRDRILEGDDFIVQYVFSKEKNINVTLRKINVTM